ncbi:hypothetical protein VMCG_03283 [Cytospora schulzeri]|uniref:DOPA 4,5-dioxygenase n=1 Tax=Cytospora schulzeri TaxID=448051 RepID=A0A423WXN9_9PEZI|nr:hypothetical protein VMCG_03283 [Valsa malicola]
MSDPSAFSYPSPLEGYENEAPLPEDISEDGKSLKNPQSGVLSKAYETFVDPLDKGSRGAFDIHIYYMQSQKEYAKQLYDRIRREFPELRIYRFWEKPIGPHPYPMFEVNLFTPAQFGAFIPWLVIWRGPLSALVHPNTDEPGLLSENELRNHTARATWLGERVPLDVSLFYGWRKKELEERQKKKDGENGGV